MWNSLIKSDECVNILWTFLTFLPALIYWNLGIFINLLWPLVKRSSLYFRSKHSKRVTACQALIIMSAYCLQHCCSFVTTDLSAYLKLFNDVVSIKCWIGLASSTRTIIKYSTFDLCGGVSIQDLYGGIVALIHVFTLVASFVMH